MERRKAMRVWFRLFARVGRNATTTRLRLAALHSPHCFEGHLFHPAAVSARMGKSAHLRLE
jgi:hypothetical protein